MKKPTLKERKFAKLIVQGEHGYKAYNKAYSPQKKEVAMVAASQVKARPHVQKLIEDALEAQGATPEWAVAQLMKVAAQDEEIGAKRLAAKDILELHGWNKADRPTVQVQFKNAFFNNKREAIDVTPDKT